MNYIPGGFPANTGKSSFLSWASRAFRRFAYFTPSTTGLGGKGSASGFLGFCRHDCPIAIWNRPAERGEGGRSSLRAPLGSWNRDRTKVRKSIPVAWPITGDGPLLPDGRLIPR